jgi:exopolysaccharide biosynthesis polyprenyl glycosylphosphotransferase
VVPGFFPLAYLRTSVGMLGDVPLVTLKEPVLNGSALLAKRVLDVVVASVSLALLWPFMLLIAVLIKLDSRGPALFKQQRLGWQSRPFHMLKFRTMVEGADKDIGLILAETEEGKRYLRKDEADPRITRFGRHLRRWSLDELPQLWNVLKGEMSLVGPRPDLPLLAQDYEPWQRMRFSVPPGMTGWWQVTGRSDRPSTLYTEEDLYYIRNYSLLLDLWILLRTVGAVIRRKGAY